LVIPARNDDWPEWLGVPWLCKTENRCLVPVTAFCEPDNSQGSRSVWTWFAKDEARLPFLFAGI
jgi:putative SOS response-associated peptidase YedK